MLQTASNWLYRHFTLRDGIQLATPSLYVEWQNPIGSTITLCWETASDRLYCHFMLRDDIWLALLPLYVADSIQLDLPSLYIKGWQPFGYTITLRRVTASNWIYHHIMLRDSIWQALLPLYVERHLIGSNATLRWKTAADALPPLYVDRQNMTGPAVALNWQTASDWLYCHFTLRGSIQLALLPLSHCKTESVKLHHHLQTYRQEWNAALQVSQLHVPTNLYTYNLQLKNSQFWYC